MSFYKLPFAAE